MTMAAGCGPRSTGIATAPSTSPVSPTLAATPSAVVIATATAAAPPQPSTSPFVLGCPAAPPSAAATAPAPRLGAAMSYDPATRSMLLFSGVTWEGPICPNTYGNHIFQDMRSLDWAMLTQHHPTALPPGRSGGAMAYDEARKTTILVGGGDPNADPARSDTCTWRGGSWTDVTLAGTPPPAPMV